MKALSRLKLFFTPKDPEDAVNKKYVDEQAAQVDMSETNPHDMLTVNEYGRITTTHISYEDLIYGCDEDFIWTEIDSNLINADLFNGYTFLQTIEIAVKAVGLPNVTNDKQVKALKTVRANNVAIWGSDGSILKDSGFTIEKSVPEDAVFTDHTYEDVTNEESGLMPALLKQKLDQLDIYRQLFFFESTDAMKKYDMSKYPHDYAYGIVGTTQYRYRKDNIEDNLTGKWKRVTDIVSDVINFSNFRLDYEGYMTVIVVQKDSTGNIVSTTEENLGKASIVPKGHWNKDTLYTYMNMVYYDGRIFMCMVTEIKGTEPGTNENIWMTCSLKAQDNYDLYCQFTEDDPPMTYDEWQKENKGKDGESGSLITDVYTNEDEETILVVETPYFDEYGVRQTKENEYNLGHVRGASAYEIAVEFGFDGSEEEWLESLKGETIAQSLAVQRNINGIMFDGTSDVHSFITCTTDPEVAIKEVTIPHMVLDRALIYIYFPEGNDCDTIKLKVNGGNALNIYYQNKIFNGKLITAGTVLSLVCVASGEFIVVGIDNTDKIKEIIGDTDKLNTADKTLVGAINETLETINKTKEELNKTIDETVDKRIGDLKDLSTNDKDNVVAAINEVFQLGCDFKQKISAAITAKDSTIYIDDPVHATVNDFVIAISRIKTDTSGNVGGGVDSMKDVYKYDNVDYDNNNVNLVIDNNAQYTAMRTIFSKNKKLMFSKQVEALMLGRYSLIIRVKSDIISDENVVELHIYKPEIPLIGQTQETLQKAYIRGKWFDKADKYKVFGLTFDIEVKNTMQVTIECSVCGVNGTSADDGVSVDYIMVNNAFTAIGSLT